MEESRSVRGQDCSSGIRDVNVLSSSFHVAALHIVVNTLVCLLDCVLVVWVLIGLHGVIGREVVWVLVLQGPRRDRQRAD